MLYKVLYLTMAKNCNGLFFLQYPGVVKQRPVLKTIANIVYITNILGVCFECAGYASLVYPLSPFMKRKLETSYLTLFVYNI